MNSDQKENKENIANVRFLPANYQMPDCFPLRFESLQHFTEYRSLRVNGPTAIFQNTTEMQRHEISRRLLDNFFSITLPDNT